MSRVPSQEELRARAKRVADKYTNGVAPSEDAPPPNMPALSYVETAREKSRRYANAQCRRRKAEIARGKVSTLSQGMKP